MSNSFASYSENNLDDSIGKETLKTQENLENLKIQNNAKPKILGENLNYATIHIDINDSVQNNSIELLGQVKKIVNYNSNIVNKINQNLENHNTPENLKNTETKQNNHSTISNLSHVSAVDNIKKLNEFKNNIDDKIENLKIKLKLKNKIKDEKLNYEKFKNLKTEIVLNFLTFLDTNDLFHMITLNREIKNQIINTIKYYTQIIITEFEKKYIRNLTIDEKLFVIRKIKKNKKGHAKINLVLKSKISSESLRDKSVMIGYTCKFPCDKESLKNVYRFDVVNPGPISFWIMREYTNVKYYIKNLVSSR